MKSAFDVDAEFGRNIMTMHLKSFAMIRGRRVGLKLTRGPKQYKRIVPIFTRSQLDVRFTPNGVRVMHVTDMTEKGVHLLNEIIECWDGKVIDEIMDLIWDGNEPFPIRLEFRGTEVRRTFTTRSGTFIRPVYTIQDWRIARDK